MPAAHQARRAPQALPLLAGRLPEVAAVFNGPHPETGEDLEVADEPHPEGAPAHDLPPQPAVFAPDYAPEEIAEIAQKLRKAAGLPTKPGGAVSKESEGMLESLLGKTKTKAKAKS